MGGRQAFGDYSSKLLGMELTIGWCIQVHLKLKFCFFNFPSLFRQYIVGCNNQIASLFCYIFSKA